MADPDRRAARLGAHDGPAHVLDATEPRVPSEDDLFLLVLDEAAAREAIVALERALHLAKRDAVRCQARRIERDPVLLLRSSVADHLDDTGDLPETRGDLPVDDRAELFRRTRGRPGAELEHVDLAQGSRDGAELGASDFLRDLVAHTDEPLRHLPAGEINVGTVGEDQRDHRDAELGDAPGLLEPRNARHVTLDALRDLRFDLGRGERGRARDDLDLRVGDIRHRIYRQVRGGDDAPQRDDPGQEERDQRILRRPSHDGAHCRVASPRRTKAPWVTTRSPLARPSVTSTMCDVRRPVVTDRTS